MRHTKPRAPFGRNRFAPTPSGSLHMGSLYLAIIDFLDAKRHHREWLLRIDDVDAPRVVEGASEAIVQALRTHKLIWNGDVRYQSTEMLHYQTALAQLADMGMIFVCHCSRKQLIREGHVTENGIKYPGTCRENTILAKDLIRNQDKTLRCRVNNDTIDWQDVRLGAQAGDLQNTCGDFVIRRNDGVFSYHLATVVDDAREGITHINRGHDLIDSAARQIYLQQLLGYARPEYSHFPLIFQENGQKLAKQNHSPAIQCDKALANWQQVLRWLAFKDADVARLHSIESCIDFATTNWFGSVVGETSRVYEPVR